MSRRRPLAFLVLALFLPHAAAQDAPLFAGLQLPTADRPVSIASADLDAEGDLDLVVVEPAAGTVRVHLGRGAGAFANPRTFAAGVRPEAVAIGDVDRDGTLDLLVGDAQTKTVLLLRGDGSGGFANAGAWSVLHAPCALVLADFDDDGSLDFATAVAAGNAITVRRGDGQGGFGPGQDLALAGSPHAVAAGDFDTDGDLDLAVATLYGNKIVVFEGDGMGAWSAPITVASFVALGLITDDFDDDGRPDLAALVGNAVRILHATAGGAFTIGAPILVNYPPRAIASGDLDGDGRLDLVVSHSSSSSGPKPVSVLLGDGHGGFGAARDFFLDSRPGQIVVGDFNGDGRRDLAVGDANDMVSLLLGDGFGGFAGSHEIALEGTAVRAIADFDLDGILDLAVVDESYVYPSGYWGMFSIRRGLGHAAFAAAGPTQGIAGLTRTIDVGDVDANGSPDVLVVTGDYYFLGQDRVHLLRAATPGVFDTTVDLLNGILAHDARFGDFDLDGDLDVAVTGSDLVGYQGKVWVLRNDGVGRFAQASVLPVGIDPRALAVGDLDLDGDLDVVVASTATNMVAVVLGDGPAGFAHAQYHAVDAIGPRDVACGDLDGDGDLDLVSANFDSGNVSVLIGDSLGGFSAASTFPVFEEARSVDVRDVDGDGRGDVVVGASSDLADFVVVLAGYAQGRFERIERNASKHWVHCTDVDADGRLDLATSDASVLEILLQGAAAPGIGALCFGDGSAPGQVGCPCANTGAAGSGCGHSTNAGGARLQGFGSTHPDDVVLQASGLPASTSGAIFLQGDARLVNGSVFGDGVKCAAGSIVRLAIETCDDGSASFPKPGSDDPSISARSAALGAPIPEGATRYYQVIFRDADPSFCAAPIGAEWNASNAVAILWR